MKGALHPQIGGDPAEAIDANQRFLSVIYAEMDRQSGASQDDARAALASVFESLGLPPEAGLDMLSSPYMRSWYAHDVRATLRAASASALTSGSPASPDPLRSCAPIVLPSSTDPSIDPGASKCKHTG